MRRFFGFRPPNGQKAVAAGSNARAQSCKDATEREKQTGTLKTYPIFLPPIFLSFPVSPPPLHLTQISSRLASLMGYCKDAVNGPDGWRDYADFGGSMPRSANQWRRNTRSAASFSRCVTTFMRHSRRGEAHGMGTSRTGSTHGTGRASPQPLAHAILTRTWTGDHPP